MPELNDPDNIGVPNLGQDTSEHDEIKNLYSDKKVEQTVSLPEVNLEGEDTVPIIKKYLNNELLLLITGRFNTIGFYTRLAILILGILILIIL